MQQLYTSESRLCEVILNQPSSLALVGRFGIHLGVGDASIGSICKAHGVDTDFFLLILNTYLHEDYFPEERFSASQLPLVIDYLERTGQYYLKVQLPNIERHFNALVSRPGGAGNNLNLLKEFFMQMKEELIQNISADSSRRFPALLALTDSSAGREDKELARLGEDAQYEIEDKLRDLLSFFVIHLEGNYDTNLCHAVVSAVFMLERDVRQNNRIRKRILMPLIDKLSAHE